MYIILLVLFFLMMIYCNLKLICLLYFALILFLLFMGVSMFQILILFVLFLYWFKHKQRKIACLFVGGLVLLFPFLKTSFIQTMYGESAFYDIPYPLDAEITPLSDANEQEFKRGKYTIFYTPRAEITLSARVVYVQYNDTYLSSFDYYSHSLYDTISPVDVSVFIKSMADRWKQFEVRYEKRLMSTSGDNFKRDEAENLHIIPANESIYKGFSTIKSGDIVIIKGYLIDWRGTGEFSRNKMQTARDFTTISDQKAGGRITGLCMQFFVTELYANGYLFK